jgi:hypothetical protein
MRYPLLIEESLSRSELRLGRKEKWSHSFSKVYFLIRSERDRIEPTATRRRSIDALRKVIKSGHPTFFRERHELHSKGPFSDRENPNLSTIARYGEHKKN